MEHYKATNWHLAIVAYLKIHIIYMRMYVKSFIELQRSQIHIEWEL